MSDINSWPRYMIQTVDLDKWQIVDIDIWVSWYR